MTTTFKDNEVTTKDYLNLIDYHINIWQRLVEEYPLNEPYKNNLAQIQQERVNFVDKIGRK